MKYLDQYSIPLKGMNKGVREYLFQIENEFFKHIEDSRISDGKFTVKLNCDKRDNMFVLDFELKGTYSAPCDKCLAAIDIPCNLDYTIYLKSGMPEIETDSLIDEDDVVMINDRDSSFNLSELIYQLIVIAMPLSNRYDCENDPDPKCDFAFLKQYDCKNNKTEDFNNPMWDSLKDIFKN